MPPGGGAQRRAAGHAAAEPMAGAGALEARHGAGPGAGGARAGAHGRTQQDLRMIDDIYVHVYIYIMHIYVIYTRIYMI